MNKKVNDLQDESLDLSVLLKMMKDAKDDDLQNDTFDFSLLAFIIRKYFVIILTATIICAVTTYYYTAKHFIPLYTVKASVIVDYNIDAEDEIDIVQYFNSVKVANLYAVLAKSDSVLQSVLDDLDSKMSYEQLKNSVQVSTVDNSQVVEFTMVSPNPEYAKKVITEFIEHSNEEIRDRVQSSSVMYLNTASVSSSGSSSSRIRRNTISGAFFGLFLSIGCLVLNLYFNSKVRSEKDITTALNVPMLGSIPYINTKRLEKMKKEDELATKNHKSHSKNKNSVKRINNMFDENIPSYYTEAYKVLATNVEFHSKKRKCKNLVITSAVENEGKTNCCVNLALALSSYGKKVCLVDCDLRRPTLHLLHRHSVGLTNVISGECTVDEALYKYTFKDKPIDIIFAGNLSSKATDILASEKMGDVASQLSEKYDYVIYDTPPCLVLADSSLVARYIDAAILVVKSGSTNRKIIVKAKNNLENAGIYLIGCILNHYKFDSDTSNYDCYSYYSQYKKDYEF